MSSSHASGATLARLEPDRTSDAELFRRWRANGDRRAREELVRRHLPLSRRLAGRYRHSGPVAEDLRQVAALGLVEAIDRFRPELGHRFSSFAVPTILGEIKRYLRDTGWSVHVPRRAQEMALAVERTRRRLYAETGREAGLDDIARALSVSLEDVLETLEIAASHYAVSLEASSEEDDDGQALALVETLGELDAHLQDVDVRLAWSQAVRRLPRREREVVGLRVARGMNQREIARQLGCSRSQVARLLEQGTTQLRDLLPAA